MGSAVTLSQFVGYQNITSKKYLESVGEDKAAQHPIGTGPFQHIEGKQGDFHRFQAVPNHWRQPSGFKELVIRRIPDPATPVGYQGRRDRHRSGVWRLSGPGAQAGLRIHETPNAALYWVMLSGQTTPDRPDYCAKCPWVGDVNDPQSLEKARQVRLALNLAVNKKAIIDGLWKGTGSETPFMYWFYPFNKGYSAGVEDPAVRCAARQKAVGRRWLWQRFEITVNPWSSPMRSTARTSWKWWRSTGRSSALKVKRAPEDFGNFLPKVRAHARPARRAGSCLAAL